MGRTFWGRRKWRKEMRKQCVVKENMRDRTGREREKEREREREEGESRLKGFLLGRKGMCASSNIAFISFWYIFR